MNFEIIRSGLEQTWTAVAAATPRILAAVVVLAVGWVVASLLRRLTGRVLTTLRVDRVVEAAGLRTSTQDTGYEPRALAAGIVYWIVLLVTFQLAAESMGAFALAAALAALVGYLPNVLVAVAVLLVALAVGGFVAGAIQANAGPRGHVSAMVARWSIIGFGAFAAVAQLQIAEPIVTALFYAAVATAGATFVIAFGVGGIPTARALTARWIGDQRDDEDPVRRVA
jgi:hypothetical protein